MTITIEVNEDFISFNGSRHVPRPINISRCRWLAFWEHLVFRGLTLQSLRLADEFMRGEKAEEECATAD